MSIGNPCTLYNRFDPINRRSAMKRIKRPRDSPVKDHVFEKEKEFRERHLRNSSLWWPTSVKNSSEPERTRHDNKSAISVERRHLIGDQDVQSLETTFDGVNGNNGAMFTVTTAPGPQEIEIVSLDINVNLEATDCAVLVYGRNGTFAGVETDPQEWTLLVNTTVVCQGFQSPTIIPSTAFLAHPKLSGNQTFSFYTALSTPNLRYSFGQSIGATAASNQVLRIHEGIGMPGLFGSGSSDINATLRRPRIWNGVVSYRIDGLLSATSSSAQPETCDNSISTSYDDNLGSYGNIFDVRAKQNSLFIDRIDFNTDIFDLVTYELYTFNSTYQQAQLSLDSWTLLKKGSINGKGSGRGTPIGGFGVNVPANHVQAFYITLTQPDIRYRDTSADLPQAQIGDVYLENDDIEILIGESVGSYPLGGSFFGPRVWSGSIYYSADRSCESESPSMAPSIAPSAASSPLGEDIELGQCTSTSNLETTKIGGTGAFGNMFTVSTKDKDISIRTMQVHVGVTEEVQVHVYTKLGPYEGFELDRVAWNEVANVNITGNGAGQLTRIPEVEFNTINMTTSTSRSFYVTLESADIRYTRTAASNGMLLATDGWLDVFVGDGIAHPPFGSVMSTYESRVFNGAIEFLHPDDCIPIVTTNITYTTIISHDPAIPVSTIVDLATWGTNEALETVFKDEESTLAEYRDSFDFTISNVQSEVADLNSVKEEVFDTCKAWNSELSCTLVDSIVTTRHKETLGSGAVTLSMLSLNNLLVESLNAAGVLDAFYVGDVPLESLVDIVLEGAFEDELDEERVGYFESVTKFYLREKFLEFNVTILGVELNDQSLVEGGRRRLQRNSPSNQLDLQTKITGEYRPPPSLNFDHSLNDMLSDEEYGDDLRTGRREVPGDIPTFEELAAVRVTAVNGVTNPPTPAPEQEIPAFSFTAVIAVAVCGFLILLCCGLGLMLWHRRRWLRTKRESTFAMTSDEFGDELIDADVEYFKGDQNQKSIVDKMENDFSGNTAKTSSYYSNASNDDAALKKQAMYGGGRQRAHSIRALGAPESPQQPSNTYGTSLGYSSTVASANQGSLHSSRTSPAIMQPNTLDHSLDNSIQQRLAQSLSSFQIMQSPSSPLPQGENSMNEITSFGNAYVGTSSRNLQQSMSTIGSVGTSMQNRYLTSSAREHLRKQQSQRQVHQQLHQSHSGSAEFEYSDLYQPNGESMPVASGHNSFSRQASFRSSPHVYERSTSRGPGGRLTKQVSSRSWDGDLYY